MSKDLTSKDLIIDIYKNIQSKLEESDNKPGLAIIQVGDRKDSNTYINLNRKILSDIAVNDKDTFKKIIDTASS